MRDQEEALRKKYITNALGSYGLYGTNISVLCNNIICTSFLSTHSICVLNRKSAQKYSCARAEPSNSKLILAISSVN